MFDSEPGASTADTDTDAGDAASARLLDQVATLEAQIRACQARQVTLVAGYAARQRDLHATELPTPDSRVGRRGLGDPELCERAIAMEVAGTLGVSHTTARMLVTDADALTSHHTTTLATLAAGRINLWVARQICTGTRILTAEQAADLDDCLAEEAAQLLPGQVRAMVETRTAAADLDAATKRAQAARAEADVFVCDRPDTVAMLGATLPVEQAAACYQALDQHARALRAQGDPRTLAHLRCDTLVERLTGAATATEAYTLELQVVLTDHTLLGTDPARAALVGHGPLPADLATNLTAQTSTWIRRLLTDPLDATLTGLDSRRRRFTGPLRDLITRRDRTCRNPVCNAPIRDLDHRIDHANGGPTTADNGDGYCERCHYLKDHPAINVEATPTPEPTHPSHQPGTPPSRPPGTLPPASTPAASTSPMPTAPPSRPPANAHGISWTGPSGRTYRSLAPPTLGHGTPTLKQLQHRRTLLNS